MAGPAFWQTFSSGTLNLPTSGLNIRIKVKLKDSSQQYFDRLMIRLRARILELAQVYQKALKHHLEKHVGSVSVGGMKRRRVVHSKPGEAPYWQTGNLANSIKVSFSSRGTTLATARISTPVKYAKELERGGPTTTARRKPFAQVRLVNPLGRNPIIAPRPIWQPLFNMMYPTMIYKIKRTIQMT